MRQQIIINDDFLPIRNAFPAEMEKENARVGRCEKQSINEFHLVELQQYCYLPNVGTINTQSTYSQSMETLFHLDNT